MEIDYFYEFVIELPIYVVNGCMTAYSDIKINNVEYLIIIASKTKQIIEPTTWMYKTNQLTHDVTFFDIGLGIIEEWNSNDIYSWVISIGNTFKQYTKLKALSSEHEITGSSLKFVTEDNIRNDFGIKYFHTKNYY